MTTARKQEPGARVPPNNLQAEEGVLGAVLLDPSPDAIEAAQAEGLTADDFYKPSHGHIWQVVEALHDQGVRADALLVADELRNQGLLDHIGGSSTLVSLQAGTPAISNAGRYARIVVEKAQARRALAALTEASEALLAGESVDMASLVLDRALAPPAPAEAHLQFMSMGELAAEVAAAPPVGWLARPVWPGDAYGVLAAEKKAGKTFSVLDLVISVASGTPWMGVFPVDTAGPVLVFLGEGGRRKMHRRMHAVGRSKGVDVDTLPIRPCFRVPHLTSAAHLAEMSAELKATTPRLVVVDPLYLAARGAKGSQLYEMGEHLEHVQQVCQAVGAALVIVHHWNKTGPGKGSDRMSGVGPGEWGRVLVSVSVRSRSTDPKSRATTVVLDWEFEGDEIPETSVRVRRKVWSENPDDLDSAMHYDVEQVEMDDDEDEPADGESLSPSSQRVLAVLEEATDWLRNDRIGTLLAETGHPLKRRTITTALKELKLARLVRDSNEGSAKTWRAVNAVDQWGRPVVFSEDNQEPLPTEPPEDPAEMWQDQEF